MTRKPSRRRTVAGHGIGADLETRTATGSMRSMLAGMCAIHGLDGSFAAAIDAIVQSEIHRTTGAPPPDDADLRTSADILVTAASKQFSDYPDAARIGSQRRHVLWLERSAGAGEPWVSLIASERLLLAAREYAAPSPTSDPLPKAA